MTGEGAQAKLLGSSTGEGIPARRRVQMRWPKSVEERERVVVRFAGDSGDGMQVAGDRFTNATAVLGNDLATLPDFPAEIRAPRGTLHGVSAFQIQFASRDILTPGDEPNVLVAMNPAALRTNLGAAREGRHDHRERGRVHGTEPREGGVCGEPARGRQLSTATRSSACRWSRSRLRATEGIEGVTKREAERAKNFFALGLVSWMYGRPDRRHRGRGSRRRFASRPEIRDANLAAFRAGWNFGETTEVFARQVRGQARPCRARRLPQRQRRGRARLGADRGERAERPAALLRELSRSRPRRSSCTSSRGTRTSASGRSRPRTRSPRRTSRSAPPSAATSASPGRAGPGWI